MTTQQTTTVSDLKSCIRIGKMYNAEGKLFHFELCNTKVVRGYKVELSIYEGEHTCKNRVFEVAQSDLTLADARTAWATYNTRVASTYSVVSHETSTKLAGQPWTEKTWEAKAEGGVRKLIASFFDGNEGSYTLEADFVTLTLISSGTMCADIPEESTTFPMPNAAELTQVYNRAVAAHGRRYHATGSVAIAMNWVRTTQEGVA